MRNFDDTLILAKPTGPFDATHRRRARPIHAFAQMGLFVFCCCAAMCAAQEPPHAPRHAEQLVSETAASEPTDDGPRYQAVVIPSRTVELSAPREGTLETVAVTLGAHVPAGATVATLQTDLLRYESAIARSAFEAAERVLNKAHINQSKADHEKQRKTEGGGAFSDSERRDAEYAVKLAAEEVAIAETTIEQRRNEVRRLENLLERSVVTAPFAAHVAARYLDPGAVVGPYTPVVRLIASDALRVRFALPAPAAAKLSPGTPVHFTFGDAGTAVPCTVENIAPEIDQALQMIVVEAAIDVAAESAIAVKPGLEGFIHVPDSPGKPTVKSPDTSATDLPRRSY